MPSVKLMTNVAFHAQALKRVRRLLQVKCGVRNLNDLGLFQVADFVMADGRKVAVRSAHWGERKQVVRAGGKAYNYSYLRLIFNCHEHGKPPRRPPHFWILLGERKGEEWIIPHRALHGSKTVQIVATKKPHNQWMRFRGAWELLTA